MTWTKLPTTYDVWSAIKAANYAQLCVFESYTDPERRMITVYGIIDADFPLMGAQTTFELERYGSEWFETKRTNEQHEYWLCINIKDDDE